MAGEQSPQRVQGSVDEPLNREPSPRSLLSSFITQEGAYDRNHGPIPQIDTTSHRVKVDGAVSKPLSLSIKDLSALPQHEIVCALQCAGNRRHTMRTSLKEVDGIDWGDAAVMNCRWRGPRLKDILEAAGVKTDQGHVAFACYQVETQDDSWYGGSIPLKRAMDEDADVILALERNSELLSPNHGAPVRVIAPGIAGARSVKWLDRISVQDQESANHYQKRDYKVLPEEATNMDEADKYWDSVPALQDMPINSVILSPASGSRIQDVTVAVSGYALPQGMDGPVVKVEVSTDGQAWTEAVLGGQEGKWSWALWNAKVTMSKGSGRRILSRATDKGGNQQSGTAAWNLRGVAYNGYGEAKDLDVV